ncbi:hypothetical protein [Longitalea luteola]
MVIKGPNGIGKTMLTAGLCYYAIKTGYRAYFGFFQFNIISMPV